MIALATSPRTILRDACILQLIARKNQASARVRSFAVSPRYLTEQETKQANTYCVIVTDEQTQGFSHATHDVSVTLKLVLYAHDAEDPRGTLDGMIEDAHDVVRGLRNQADVASQLWNIMPDTVTTDEATTAAGPWAQAVCVWTVRVSRA
jgi:hypothetical protein